MSCSNKRNQQQQRRQQQGGAGSGWRNSSHARYVQPGTITQLTLNEIDQAPMFNPLQTGTKIPMGYVSTGIVPEGIYYMNESAKKHCRNFEGCQQPGVVQRQIKTGRESLISELKRVME